LIGSTIYRLAACVSTNDVAKRLAEEGAEDGTVVIAGEQTGGRGTKGRGWHSARGLGLYASVILRPRRRDIALVPVAAGVAAAEAVGLAAGVRVRLKWPNDLVWRGKKLGGILTESAFRGPEAVHVIIGLGLNLNHGPLDFPADIRRAATSLRLAKKNPWDTASLEPALWAALERWRAALETGRDEQIIRAFEARLTFPVGAEVGVEKESGSFAGTLRGLDAEARLVVECGSLRVRLSPAEIVSIKGTRSLTV